MKKYLKVISIIFLILICVIVLDTIQARLFKNSPFISFKEEFLDGSYVDKGILMDTYYCVKEQDIVTVSWHFKTDKFTCSNEVEELNEVENVSLKIKEGTLTKTGATIIITDLNEEKYTYGEYFRIDKKEDNGWQELKPIIKNYAFNSIGYLVNENNQLELNHDWSILYGSLEKGKYRLVKDVYDANNDTRKYFSVEFIIEE